MSHTTATIDSIARLAGEASMAYKLKLNPAEMNKLHEFIEMKAFILFYGEIYGKHPFGDAGYHLMKEYVENYMLCINSVDFCRSLCRILTHQEAKRIADIALHAKERFVWIL